MTKHTNTQLIDMFLGHQRGRSFSEFTVRRRRSSLANLARWIAPLGFADVDTDTIEDWVASLNAPRTRHAYQSDACAFYAWAVRRQVLASNPAADADSVRVPKGIPRPVPADAVRFIIASAPDRDLRVGLALAAFAGQRRSEIVALQSDDVSLISRPPILTVRNGKWNKDRQVPIHPELVRLLGRRQVQGQVVRLTADTFGRRAADHIRRCGYDFSVHSLRATFATELARITDGNVLLVARLLGHESMQTAIGYIGLAGYAGAERVNDMYGDDAA